MKKHNILYFLFAFTLIFVSCEDTNENLVGSRGVAVVPVISDVNPAFYTTDFADTFVQFTVDLPEGETVDAAELQATFDGKTEVLQSITSFPATINIPASEALAAFNLNESDVEVDDSILFQVVTTSAGISSRSLASLKVFVTCEFDPELSEGSYHFVSEDMETEGDVVFTADPDDPYLIAVSGLFAAEGGNPNDNILYLKINPSDFSVTHDKTLLGTTDPFGFGYGNYTFAPSSGLYKSCTGNFEMVFAISVNEGSFGNNKYVFTKN